ncbi:hypothetical protein BDN70DRAFT_516917 [Pholiota conissans]|uniref:Uncharacterized protein n=1 Tax=Pholiota conissans TaxID=109636 RepID=A0A9P5YLC4_9AGAR|nr:hypothetical protein BDN70DRAFT_516917 [Pholiota conissans]
MKLRTPQDFVPAIISCNIISDTGDKVLRLVGFRDGVTAQEEIEEYQGTIVYFDSSTMGTRITNILSYNETNQMVLTFSFSGGLPGYSIPSSDAAPPSVKELNQTVGLVVEHTISRIRELVKDGTIA